MLVRFYFIRRCSHLCKCVLQIIFASAEVFFTTGLLKNSVEEAAGIKFVMLVILVYLLLLALIDSSSYNGTPLSQWQL